MTPASNGKTDIIRTERGLTIAGTRITLYDVMDYITEHYPPNCDRVSCRVRSLMQLLLLQRSIFGERTMPMD